MTQFLSKLKLISAALALGLLATGCTSLLPRDYVLGPSYKPTNVFLPSPALPPAVKRVALLPLSADPAHLDLVQGREILAPVLAAELSKCAQFETVPADAPVVRLRTGQANWGAEDTLPPEFFEGLRERTGCDAVLFCRLTTFRGYAPLAVGWRLRLVEVATRQTLWAADEVFDAGQPAVQAGARRYQLSQAGTPDRVPDEWTISNSPRQFGQYAVAELLATLPVRP